MIFRCNWKYYSLSCLPRRLTNKLNNLPKQKFWVYNYYGNFFSWKSSHKKNMIYTKYIKLLKALMLSHLYESFAHCSQCLFIIFEYAAYLLTNNYFTYRHFCVVSGLPKLVMLYEIIPFGLRAPFSSISSLLLHSLQFVYTAKLLRLPQTEVRYLLMSLIMLVAYSI